jgi:hypothetical protein
MGSSAAAAAAAATAVALAAPMAVVLGTALKLGNEVLLALAVGFGVMIGEA